MTLHYSTENSYHYGKHQHFLYNPSSNKPAALAAYLNTRFYLNQLVIQVQFHLHQDCVVN